MEKLIDISQIKVGKRARKKAGDLDGLAKSIAQHGLLHAVVVNQEHQLIAGWPPSCWWRRRASVTRPL